MREQDVIEEIMLGRKKLEIEKFFDNVVETYGKESQLRQLQEECGEVIVAVNHYLRAVQQKDTKKISLTTCNLIEEVADVEILIAQLPCMFLGFREAVDEVKEKKLKRLAERIEMQK